MSSSQHTGGEEEDVGIGVAGDVVVLEEQEVDADERARGAAEEAHVPAEARLARIEP